MMDHVHTSPLLPTTSSWPVSISPTSPLWNTVSPPRSPHTHTHTHIQQLHQHHQQQQPSTHEREWNSNNVDDEPSRKRKRYPHHESLSVSFSSSDLADTHHLTTTMDTLPLSVQHSTLNNNNTSINTLYSSNSSLPDSEQDTEHHTSPSSSSSSPGMTSTSPSPFNRISNTTTTVSIHTTNTNTNTFPSLPASDNNSDMSTPSSIPLFHRDHTNESLSKQVKHQLSDRQRRLKIKIKLQELTSIVTAQHQLARTDQMSVISKSVDMLIELQNQVKRLKDHVQHAEVEKARYENEIKTLQQQCNSFNHVLTTLNSQGLSSPINNILSSSIPPALNAMGVSICRINHTGTIFEVNNAYCLLTGYNLSELIGRSTPAFPLYSSVYRIPTPILQTFSPIPVVDDMTELSKYEYAVNNDFQEVFLAQSHDETFHTHPEIHPYVNKSLVHSHNAASYSSFPFSPPTSVASQLFSSPCVIPISMCQRIHCKKQHI